MRRRDFVMRAAAVGGYGAALTMLHALGLSPDSAQAAPRRDPTVGRGRRVAILGGGMAGLVAAYELDKAGFAVTVLEARTRVGGRNWTVRGGDRVESLSRPAQDVTYDPGQYLNCGPARLPSHHKTILGYCRELGVPLEVEINASRSAYVVRRDGKRVRMRQVVNDTRGHVAELLAKMANQGALDAHLEGVERKQMLDFLRLYGDLKDGDAFVATDRSGYKVLPGAAAQAGVPLDKLSLADVTQPSMYLAHVFEEAVDMQPTMFQPVGGMDQIPKAFARALDGRVRTGCEVRSVRCGTNGATVVWREGRDTRTIEADYVISTLPASMMARLPCNLTPTYAQAVRAVALDHSCKIGWQGPRFWEREDEIYGGLAYMDHETRFLWYPSAGLHSETGVLLACYNAGADAAAFGAKSRLAQIASSRAAVDLAHPGRGHLLGKPIVIVWRDTPWSEGPWARLDPADEVYRKLNEPDGRLYLAGDWLSHLSGWQEGAALSAHRAVDSITARAHADNLAAPV
ncbi:MAG: FAD-dependent oxidoreductase [Hyphomonadaceae bacterium]|nr:FAD-dependent oxidoreductase [Hyphomonadaceae bacterium]